MYKLIGLKSVKRLTDGACIPFADGNRDYEKYKQWLAEGNIPEPEFTEAEITQQELEAKIAEARAYLQATDYVAVKYNDEVTVTGSMTKTAFLAKYADVYAKRAEARAIVSGGE